MTLKVQVTVTVQASPELSFRLNERRTEEGKPLVLNVVRKAEQNVISRPSENKACATSAFAFTQHRQGILPCPATMALTCMVVPPWCGSLHLHRACAAQEYLGITGNPKFNELSAKLAFGEGSRVIAEGRNATVQALSGTGSLRVRAPALFLCMHDMPLAGHIGSSRHSCGECACSPVYRVSCRASCPESLCHAHCCGGAA